MNCLRRGLTSAGILLAAGLMFISSFSWGAQTATVCKKEIPEVAFENLSLPYKDYPYFQHHAIFLWNNLVENQN